MAEDLNGQIRETLLALVQARGTGKTICPSEVARALDSEDWQRHLKPIRREAQLLARDGQIAIYRKGKQIDPDLMKGVIRLGLP